MMASGSSSGKLPRTFWFLVTGVFINRLGSFIYIFLAYYLTQKRGFSAPQAGTVVALYGAGALTSGPIGGFLADRLGRRTSMLIATLVGAGAMLHLGFAITFWHTMVAAFILGVLGDLYRPAVNAAIADLVTPADRVRAYGWSYWAANLGFSVAAVLGGFLAERHFTLLFFMDAGTTLLFGFLIFLFVPETRIAPEIQTPLPSSSSHSAEMMGSRPPYLDPVFVSFIAIQFLLEFLLAQSLVALPLDIAQHGIPIQIVGYFNALNAILIVLVQPFLRQAVQSFPRSRVLASGAMLLGIGLSLNLVILPRLGILFSSPVPWTPGKVLLFAVTFLPTVTWTIGEMLMFSMVPATIADLAPQNARGSYQGAYQFIVSSSALVAPLYGTYLLSHVGSKMLWLSCLGIGLGAAVLHIVTAPLRKHHLTKLYGAAEARRREDGKLE